MTAHEDKRTEDMKWRTKDGRSVGVINMTDDHLINAYRLCERKGLVTWDYIKPFFGPPPDGDMAEDAFYHDMDRAMNRHSHIMDSLKEEIDRRGLKETTE